MAARDTTFCFTDIAGSTDILRRIGEARYDELLERHRDLIRRALRAAGGQEIKTEGDGFFVTFDDPEGALRFVVSAQQALGAEAWPVSLRVRMGLHRGPGTRRYDGDYSSLAAHQAARVTAAAHGGQVVVTDAVVRAVEPPADVRLVHLGPHRLRDFDGPVELLQLVAPGMADGFPPLRATREDHGLPLPRSSMVGRDEELRALRELLGSHPFVTLHGPGGVGKTRLALEAAASMAASFPDGLHLAELSPVGDPALVMATVAAAVGVANVPGRRLDEVLLATLRSGLRLLILDSAERVLDPVAELVEEIVRTCPGCSVLVTTTELVRAREERVVNVAPLPEPDAVRLLVHRASMRGADVDPGAAATTALTTIAQRLDGIPLALELAAGRIAELGLDATLDGLDDRFELLTNGWRTALPRHRTLEGMVEWTVSLLDQSEQQLLRRLATLRGRWKTRDAITVYGGEESVAEAALQRLVDRSLVSLDDEDPPRLRMFDTIRAYVEARVDLDGTSVGDLLDVKRRWLRAHIRGLVDVTDEVLRLEMDNLIPDLREATTVPFADDERAGDAAELTALISPWFEATGLWSEAVSRLQAAVDAAPPGPQRAAAVATLAQHCVLLGDLATARELAQNVLVDPDAESNARVLALLTLSPPTEVPVDGADPLGEALRLAGRPESTLALMVRSRMAQRALARGDAASAIAGLEDVIDVARANGRTVVWIQGLVNLGSALLRAGRIDDAEAALSEGRAAAAGDIGVPQLRAISLTGLSMIALYRGDAAAALAFAEERLSLARQMTDLLGQATAHVAVANASLALGDRTRAKEENRAAHEAFHKLDLLDGSATALFNLAALADGEGDTGEATRAVSDLLRAVAPRENPVLRSLALFAVAAVAAGRGIARAAELVGAEEKLRPEASPLDPADLAWIDVRVDELETALGRDAVAAARARGAALDLEGALALAEALVLELI
ncbi:MAG TPA: adenylate/guanylate cyclase domain-containing protein [Acidimicrobiales bacterium]|nr:adenylate/guanylate cyclase domain-containing protein [Acidimicrobiales bacterium]